MKYTKQIIAYLICTGLSLAAGGIGSLATNSKIPTWYAALEKPFFNPPSWVFGPVWTTLYVLMGTALYLVWRSGAAAKTRAFAAFGVQLALNTLWSLVFFGLESPLLGTLVIFALLAAIIWTMREFYKIHKISCYLLIPYIAWVGFATCLTIAIFVKN